MKSPFGTAQISGVNLSAEVEPRAARSLPFVPERRSGSHQVGRRVDRKID
jgi:hypothetical protein